MKYLCMIHNNREALDALSKREWDTLVNNHLDYDDVLRQSGHFVLGEALHPPESATIVRMRNGKLSVTDGPFAEAREQLGGIILIDARDLNEAIQIASKMPSIHLSSIEVRPVRELNRTEL